MIRIVLLGRCGNNLFQYACGRVLAERHGVPLVMDASWFTPADWGEVSHLRRLPLKAEVVRRCSPGARALRRLAGIHYWELRGVPMLREAEGDMSFDPRFLAAPADCLLFGYFQTPRYFAGIEPQLREELRTDGLGLEAGHEDLAERMREPGSVAVHVRRGDYGGNPTLDVCGMDYYDDAMARLGQAVRAPRFFVFSDDPGWCKSRFQGPDIICVPNIPGQSPLVDLHLMSLANHHVIANSSYSWWAAWLGKKPGQRVLMPPRWFQGIHAPIAEKQCEGWEIVTGKEPLS